MLIMEAMVERALRLSLLMVGGKMVMALMLMGLQLFLLVVQEIVDFLALEHLFGVRQTLVEVMLLI